MKQRTIGTRFADTLKIGAFVFATALPLYGGCAGKNATPPEKVATQPEAKTMVDTPAPQPGTKTVAVASPISMESGTKNGNANVAATTEITRLAAQRSNGQDAAVFKTIAVPLVQGGGKKRAARAPKAAAPVSKSAFAPCDVKDAKRMTMLDASNVFKHAVFDAVADYKACFCSDIVTVRFMECEITPGKLGTYAKAVSVTGADTENGAILQTVAAKLKGLTDPHATITGPRLYTYLVQFRENTGGNR
jgi:hypothetical protein